MVLAKEDVFVAWSFRSLGGIQRTHYDVCFTVRCANVPFKLNLCFISPYFSIL